MIDDTLSCRLLSFDHKKKSQALKIPKIKDKKTKNSQKKETLIDIFDLLIDGLFVSSRKIVKLTFGVKIFK